MQMISSLLPAAAQPPAAIQDTGKTPENQRPGDAIQRYPAEDEYIPSEQQEATGRYWLSRDENGKPIVSVDNTEQAAEAPEKPGALPEDKAPEKPENGKSPDKKEAAGKAGGCTGNTDKVDREIEKLKKEREELKKKISAEQDDKKLEQLQKRLEEVERELNEKDNDAYRRQHTVYTYF